MRIEIKILLLIVFSAFVFLWLPSQVSAITCLGNSWSYCKNFDGSCNYGCAFDCGSAGCSPASNCGAVICAGGCGIYASYCGAAPPPAPAECGTACSCNVYGVCSPSCGSLTCDGTKCWASSCDVVIPPPPPPPPPPPQYCGDGGCNQGGAETCQNCPGDCGACRATVVGNIYLSPDNNASLVGTNCTGANAGTLGAGVATPVTVRNGTYTYNANNSGGTYTTGQTVIYNNGYVAELAIVDPTYQMVCPASGMYPSFDIAGAPGQVITRDFYLLEWQDPWVQTVGGDIMAKSASAGINLRNQIPATCTGSCSPYTSLKLNNTDQSTGVFTYGAGAANVNSYDEESRALAAQSGYRGRYEGYAYYKKRYEVSIENPVSDWNVTDLEHATKPTTTKERHLALGNMTIDNIWQLNSGEKIVVLVNGNLTISNEIHVPDDAFLAFIVSGNISISPTLGRADFADNNPLVEGVYIADGTFSTGSLGDFMDSRFVGAGTFVGWTGVDLQRSLLGSGNDLNAAEFFVYRPDFILSAPEKFKYPLQIWQEVAP